MGSPSTTWLCMGTEAVHVRDISVIVGALARVNCVDANTMSRFADGCVQTLPQATPLELARLMHACMSVSCHAPDLFTACVLQSREQAASLDPSGLSAAAYAFGQCFEVADVSHVRYLQKIFRHLRLAAVSGLPLFLPREIVSLLKTYARWQITFECGDLRKVAERMIATSSQFDLDSAVSGLHNLALLMQRNAMRSERTAALGAAREVLAEAARNLLLPAREANRLVLSNLLSCCIGGGASQFYLAVPTNKASEPNHHNHRSKEQPHATTEDNLTRALVGAGQKLLAAMGRSPRRPGQALLYSAATFGGLVLLSRSWAFVRLTTRPLLRQQADAGAILRRLPERWSGRRVTLHANPEVTEELSGLQD
eukprot:s4459_g7.t1